MSKHYIQHRRSTAYTRTDLVVGGRWWRVSAAESRDPRPFHFVDTVHASPYLLTYLRDESLSYFTSKA